MSDDVKDDPPVPAAPAVHDSELWDGPKFIENASAEPVWVETKQAYWDLLNQTGFRMKDQQESRTGPEQAPTPWVPPDPVQDPICPKDFTPEEANILYAYKAVLQTYELLETLWCEACFRRGDRHGVRANVGDNIRFQCRCGTYGYRPPVGTTDTLTSLPNRARVLGDTTTGTLQSAEGQTTVPTDLLSDEDALIIRAYVGGILIPRNLETLLFCRRCFTGRVSNDTAMNVCVTDEQVVLTCSCRIRYAQGKRLSVH